MKHILAKNPFFFLGLTGIVLYWGVFLLGIPYDARNLFTAMIYWMSQLLGYVVVGPSELLFTINNGESVPLHDLLATTMGVLVCLLLDIIYRFSKVLWVRFHKSNVL